MKRLLNKLFYYIFRKRVVVYSRIGYISEQSIVMCHNTETLIDAEKEKVIDCLLKEVKKHIVLEVSNNKELRQKEIRAKIYLVK